jgi:SAM-dependent methyltransferase
VKLTARYEKFTTTSEHWTNTIGFKDPKQALKNMNKFYAANYQKILPQNKNAKILVTSSGSGFLLNFLKDCGYNNYLGVDTNPDKVLKCNKEGFFSECICCFDYLQKNKDLFDVIIVNKELDHLTRKEILLFLKLCKESLKKEGRLIVSAHNANNAIVSTEIIGTFDHYTVLQEDTVGDLLRFSGFRKVKVLPVKYYVFWHNPFNYFALAFTSIIHLFLYTCFKVYGKEGKIFTKKIIGLGFKI